MPQGPFQMQTLSSQFYRLVDGYFRFGGELWGRSWTLAADSLQRTVREVERDIAAPRRPERLFRDLLGKYVDYLSGMAALVPLAAETAAALAGSAARAAPAEDDRPIEAGAPQVIGAMYELPAGGPDGRPVSLALPVRCIDASQGWAMYIVPRRRAAEMLGAGADVATPFDLGGGRALLAVMGIDYRVGDLGKCQEIALALAVTPVDAPDDVPGAMFIGIGVSGELARDAAQAVWGLEMLYSPDLSVGYRSDRVRFGVGSDDSEGFSISFPRFGTRRFDGIPIVIYSRQDSGDGRPATRLRSVMSLSGRGQGFQFGGTVSIGLGSPRTAGCLCRGSVERCLCRMLQELDVTERLPVANGWTEHLSGTFEAPQALHLSR